MGKKRKVNYCCIMPTRASPFTNNLITYRHTLRYWQQSKIRNEEAKIEKKKDYSVTATSGKERRAVGQRQLPASYIQLYLISQGRLELYLDLSFKIAETREQKTLVTQFWLRCNDNFTRLLHHRWRIPYILFVVFSHFWETEWVNKSSLGAH